MRNETKTTLWLIVCVFCIPMIIIFGSLWYLLMLSSDLITAKIWRKREHEMLNSDTDTE